MYSKPESLCRSALGNNLMGADKNSYQGHNSFCCMFQEYHRPQTHNTHSNVSFPNMDAAVNVIQG